MSWFTYNGHLAGDAVLSAVAAAITALLRDYDLIGREDGEEFAFVLPNTPVQDAVEIAERLREKIPSSCSSTRGWPGRCLPVSQCLSAWPPPTGPAGIWPGVTA